MKKNTKNILIILLVVLCVFAIASLLNNSSAPKEIDYGNLQESIKNGDVAGIYVKNNYIAYVLYKDGHVNHKVDAKRFPKQADAVVNIGSRRELELFINGLPDTVAKPILSFNNPDKSGMWMSFLPIVGMLVLGGVFLYVFSKSNGANNTAMNFGKTKARLNQNIKVRFADVAGAEEEKEELAEIVEFLKNPKKFADLGARIPKGVLLVGPPGTGKTLFAKAVAGEAGVPFFSISGSDFVEMFVGTGAARVRDLFEQAKHNMPCIIFIDEIDAVGRKRGAGLGGGHDEREQTLNQLLVQMDGFESNDGIIIMAATNRADILDPALLRPGRFDRQIAVNPPDVKGREAIFKVHARNKPLAPDVNFKNLARLTSGFSGADIENLLNEAAILAARNDRRLIIMEDINEAINKVIAGPQKKSRVVSDSDKRITAYHEAGHAIVGKLLPHCDGVHEVSIIPRGMAAGYTITRPDNDDSHVTKNKLEDTIAMMLAGRAAEEIVIQDISTGASNDIQRASSIARQMVTEWGMSDKLGTLFLGSSGEVFLGRDYGSQHQYSEEIAGIIDQEIKSILDNNYVRAREILLNNRAMLDNMVKVLFEKETIFDDELSLIFEGKPANEVIAYANEKNDNIKKNASKLPNADLIVPEKPAEAKAEAVDSTASEDTKVELAEQSEAIADSSANTSEKPAEGNEEESKAEEKPNSEGKKDN